MLRNTVEGTLPRHDRARWRNSARAWGAEAAPSTAPEDDLHQEVGDEDTGDEGQAAHASAPASSASAAGWLAATGIPRAAAAGNAAEQCSGSWLKTG